MNNLCRSWADVLDNFHYHVVEDCGALKNPGERLIQIMQDHMKPLLNDCDFYLSGNDRTIDNVADFLRESGLPDNQLFLQSS